MPTAASSRSSKKSKYGVAEKYVRMCSETDHSASGDAAAIAADSREMYEAMQPSRDRANSTVESDD